MSRTSLEYLFQVTSPAADRPFGTTSRGDDGGRFGDHLSKVASPTGNRPKAPDSSSRSASRDKPVDRTASSKSAKDDSRESARTPTAREAKNAGEVRDPSSEEAASVIDSDAVDAAETADALTDDDEHRNEQAAAAAVAATDMAMQNAAAAGEVEKTPEAELEVASVAANAPDSNADDSGYEASSKTQPIETGAEVPVEPIVETTLASTAVGANASVAGPDGTQSHKDSRDARKASDSASASEDSAMLLRTERSSTMGAPATTAEVSRANGEQSNIDLTPHETTANDDSNQRGDLADDANRSANPTRADGTSLAHKPVVAAVVNGPAENASTTADGNQTANKPAAAKLDGVADAASRHTTSTGTRRGSRANSMDETPRIDPARFVSRVAKAFHTAQDRGGTLQLRLSPPELGAMRLELTVKDGVMSASLETENATAKRVLLEHLPALRDRLAEQNIRIERFDVDVRRDGAGGQADPRAAHDQQQSQQGQSERRQPPQAQREVVAPRTNQAISQPLGVSTGINLVA